MNYGSLPAQSFQRSKTQKKKRVERLLQQLLNDMLELTMKTSVL